MSGGKTFQLTVHAVPDPLVKRPRPKIERVDARVGAALRDREHLEIREQPVANPSSASDRIDRERMHVEPVPRDHREYTAKYHALIVTSSERNLDDVPYANLGRMHINQAAVEMLDVLRRNRVLAADHHFTREAR